MTINYTIDERRDPIRASHAAAKLLKRNYSKLNSWPMAITAYNHGLSGMLRAQRKHGHYENVFNNYRSRTFKFASRNFYSEFLAARAVADNYQQYFGDLTLNTPIKTKEITLTGYTSIPNLAQKLDIDLNRLRQLNPALRPPVFKGRKYAPKGYRLKLPADDHRDWKALIAAAAEDVYRPDQKHSRLYQVDRGDTAGKIARLHGVSLQDLIAFNNLDSRARIYVGQNLRIPVPETRTKMIASRTPLRQVKTDSTDIQPIKKNKNPDVETRKGPELAPHRQKPLVAAVTTEPSGPANPTIAPDDSAGNTENVTDDIKSLILASQTTGALQEVAIESDSGDMVATEIPKKTIAGVTKPSTEQYVSPVSQVSFTKVEKELTPLTGREPDPEMVTGSITVEKVIQQENRSVGIIQVEIEETIGHYAEWAGVRARDIRRMNKIRYGHPIRLGQKLKIPLHRVNKEAFEETRFEYHKELVEDFFAAYRVDALKIYSINRGDNIWTLSRDVFELPLWLIRRYNSNVDLSALIPSQNLRIPVVEKTS
jgi:membrane-bound lytic murein transglycosylase D